MAASRRLSKSQFSFIGRALPLFALLAAGSWGLSQFLKLPTQLKDERRRQRREGREKFDLNQELERVTLQLGEQPSTYENKRVPGPRDPNRHAAP